MSITTNRAQRRQLARDNAKLPSELAGVPRHEWPDPSAPQWAVWRSREFLVQAFKEAGGVMRLSINRTTLNGSGRWVDGITWDEVQRLKRECGFGDRWAVEVFPADAEIVNVANVRHIWLLPEPPAFAWHSKSAGAAGSASRG